MFCSCIGGAAAQDRLQRLAGLGRLAGGIEKGWFKEAGVDVKFEWFDYVGLDGAFAAGKVDAVTMTNGDALVTAPGGAKSVMIMITDYTNGNDMIVAKPGIKSLKELKGKKVGLEVGFVEHLLLLNGLKKAGMKETDVKLVNAKTNETPQVLASGDVAAIGAWQPISGQAMKRVPGSKPIYTSADEPGLIYDVLAVNPASVPSPPRRLGEGRRRSGTGSSNYINDPKTQADAVKIMAARVGLTPEDYMPLLEGHQAAEPERAKKIFVKGDGFDSLYGSTKIADDFNWRTRSTRQPRTSTATSIRRSPTPSKRGSLRCTALECVDLHIWLATDSSRRASERCW